MGGGAVIVSDRLNIWLWLLIKAIERCGYLLKVKGERYFLLKRKVDIWLAVTCKW